MKYDKHGCGDTVLLQLQRPANMSNEEWWASVLLSEQKRFEVDQNSRLVELDDILPDAGSSDDDIPIIVGTLQTKKQKPKPKKKRKELWTYEAVAEPTGIVSKYWELGRVCASGAHHQETGEGKVERFKGRRYVMHRSTQLPHNYSCPI